MGNPLPARKRGEELSDGPAAAAVPVLVRRIVQHLAGAGPPAGAPAPEAGGEEVLLDVEVDGVRCLLIRVAARASPARVLLSPREREISRMVSKGYPNKMIAGVLDISSWTVGTYLRRIFAKLGVGCRAAMVTRILEEGLLGEADVPSTGRLTGRARGP
jgi:DNA-binding NarL/FixJ family response regulator